jgi:hypothetical protein
MSPLTARVSESSVGATVVIDSLVVAAEFLVVVFVVESIEVDAHAVNTTAMAQNLVKRFKVNSL